MNTHSQALQLTIKFTPPIVALIFTASELVRYSQEALRYK